jgi:predicted ATPase
VLATYAENAYDVVEIPRVPVEQRVRFVLDYIGPGSNP